MIHTKHINTVCGQKVELLNVKLVVHIDGRIILRWIFRKLEWVGGTGWSWLLRIGTGGGHLWVR